jgi:hypothetical protein
MKTGYQIGNNDLMSPAKPSKTVISRFIGKVS